MELYRLPTVGGSALRIVSDADSGLTISPDGSKVAFSRGNQKVRPWENYVIVANSDGTNQHRILTLKEPQVISQAAWSPDGLSLALGIREEYMAAKRIVLVTADGGSEQRSIQNVWFLAMAWLSDGSGLALCGSGPQVEGRDPVQLWILSLPNGQLRRLTHDLNEYRGLGLSADAKRLVSSQKQLSSSIWIVPTSNLSDAKEITASAGRMDGFKGLAWLRNESLLYYGSDSELWRMNPDGSHRQQLTYLRGYASDPSATRDGATVLFSYKDNVWRMNGDGSNPQQVTNFKEYYLDAQISTDGKWFTYSTADSVLKKPLSGGDATSLDKNGEFPAISPDGRWIAFIHFDDKKDQLAIAIDSADGEGSTLLLPFIPVLEEQIPTMGTHQPLRWTASGDAITYVRTKGGVSNLWSQPVNGRPAKQITNFTSGVIWRHAWSPTASTWRLREAFSPKTPSCRPMCVRRDGFHFCHEENHVSRTALDHLNADSAAYDCGSPLQGRQLLAFAARALLSKSTSLRLERRDYDLPASGALLSFPHFPDKYSGYNGLL